MTRYYKKCCTWHKSVADATDMSASENAVLLGSHLPLIVEMHRHEMFHHSDHHPFPDFRVYKNVLNDNTKRTVNDFNPAPRCDLTTPSPHVTPARSHVTDYGLIARESSMSAPSQFIGALIPIIRRFVHSTRALIHCRLHGANGAIGCSMHTTLHAKILERNHCTWLCKTLYVIATL